MGPKRPRHRLCSVRTWCSCHPALLVTLTPEQDFAVVKEEAVVGSWRFAGGPVGRGRMR